MPAVARSIQAAFQDQSVVIAPVGNIVANKTDQMQVLLAAAAQDFASRYVGADEDVTHPI